MGIAFENIELVIRERAAREELEIAEREREQLNEIGDGAFFERDVDALLTLILAKAREITGADAGSLYLVEEDSRRTPAFAVHADAERQRGFSIQGIYAAAGGRFHGGLHGSARRSVEFRRRLPSRRKIAISFQRSLRPRFRLPHEIAADPADAQRQGRSAGRVAAHQLQTDLRGAPAQRSRRGQACPAVPGALGAAGAFARVASRGFLRKSQALSRNRNAIRRLRAGGGHGD